MFTWMKGYWFSNISLLLVILLSVGCGGTPAPVADSPAGNQAETPVTLRLGYVPVMIFAPLFVAVERGYFADEGLQVELTPVQGGSDSVVQLAAGNFDAAAGGAGAGLFNAAARGVQFTIVAPLHSERPPITTPLVISAQRTAEFQRIADLRGKRVAINATGSATEYWLSQALAQDGLTLDDVQLTAMPFPNMPAALENGSLDAAILGDPLVTIRADNGLVTVLADDFIDGVPSPFLSMGKELLDQPEVARAFMRAYLRACRDLHGDYMNVEIAAIIETSPQTPADAVLRRSPASDDPDGQINLADLQPVQEYCMGRGALEYDELLDVSMLVHTQLAREVAAERDQEEEE